MYLGRPRLLVVNFAECFRFYRDVMGFQVTWGNENDGYAAFSDREGQETTLALFRREAMAEVVGTADLPAEAVCQDRVRSLSRLAKRMGKLPRRAMAETGAQASP